jgi:hypothetical protein
MEIVNLFKLFQAGEILNLLLVSLFYIVERFITIRSFKKENNNIRAFYNMLKQLCHTIANHKKYFSLAKRTECYLSFSISIDIVLLFNNLWNENQSNWNFWLVFSQRSRKLLLGSLEQIGKLAYDTLFPNDNILEDYNVVVLVDLPLDQFTGEIERQLYYHVTKWEEKIYYPSNTQLEEVNTGIQISLKEAKQRLKIIYQFLFEVTLFYTPRERRLTLVQYKTIGGHFGDLFYDVERDSFITAIDGNCVDEVEAPLLQVMIRMVEKQTSITRGQLGILKFIDKCSEICNKTL